MKEDYELNFTFPPEAQLGEFTMVSQPIWLILVDWFVFKWGLEDNMVRGLLFAWENGW